MNTQPPEPKLAQPTAEELDHALYVLARCHTRDDHYVGFSVHSYHPTVAPASQSEYIIAWEVVRRHLHMPTEPSCV